MDSIVRAVVVYLILLIIFRISGKRTLSQTTTFDLVLALIISESIQQALLSRDSSATHAVLLVIGLVGSDIVLSLLKQKSQFFARLAEGIPAVVLKDGKLQEREMNRERVDEEDIMEAARLRLGLARLDQIAYAVVERSGEISIVPRAEQRL
jgi:uncharacterized membrane protein YcaP (DUF421 family)